MYTARKTAITVGLLYITGTVAGILSVVAMGPLRDAQDYLSVPGGETRLAVGALCVLTMGLALALVPVMMFPILKKRNEALALGYVVFRSGLEAVGYLLIAASWLLLASVGQTGVFETNVQALSTLILDSDYLGSLLTIVFSIGACIFYYLLYRTRLVPRWLSGWGLVALVPYVASGGFLAMFGILEALSPTYAALQLPLALQEMVLALWLVVRGFNSSAIAALSEQELVAAS